MLDLISVVTIVLGCGLLGMSLVVFGVYAKKVKKNKRRKSWLHMHVTVIAMSYSMLVILVVLDQVFKIANDSHATWRLLLALPAFGLGDLALYVLLKSLKSAEFAGRNRAGAGS